MKSEATPAKMAANPNTGPSGVNRSNMSWSGGSEWASTRSSQVQSSRPSAALGLLLCTWLLRVLAHSLPPLQDMFERFTPDGPVFGFAAIFAGVASLFIGVGPAL